MSEVIRMREIAAAYQDFVVAHGLERAEVFEAIAERFAPASVLYPGCFLHLTPAFYLPRVTFLDKNERAAKLFAQADEVASFVNDHKQYRQSPGIRFLRHDYEQPLPLGRERFGMLIVLHAPGALAAGLPWLAKGGLLLVNETYGQAADAAANQALEALGVFVPERRGFRFQAGTNLQAEAQSHAHERIWLFRSLS